MIEKIINFIGLRCYIISWIYAYTIEMIIHFIGLCIDKVLYQGRMLKHRPKLWRDKRYVPDDEFDKSLDMNGYAMMDMNKEDRTTYLNDLTKRRRIAHERDMNQ